MIELTLERSLSEIWKGDAVLACCFFSGCKSIGSLGPEFEREVELVIGEIKAKGASVLAEPRMEQMRTTFRAMPDMDPARYRPASESLIRRCVERGFFRIKPLVDLNNLLSIQLRLPLGIYDLTGWESTAWTYRIGFPGEKYLTISKQEKSAEGKLVVADDKGVVGSPVADSGRASVKDKANQIRIIVFLPFGFTPEMATDVAREIQRAFGRFFEPKTSEVHIVRR